MDERMCIVHLFVNSDYTKSFTEEEKHYKTVVLRINYYF